MSFELDSKLSSDCLSLGHFNLCQLLLVNDSQFPWFVLVPKRDNITEIFQLSNTDQSRLWLESRLVSIAVMEIFEGEKLNVAAIGNVVNQLHLHHVVRFKKDVCWPKPVWGQVPPKAYQIHQIDEIRRKTTTHLACFGFDARLKTGSY